MEATFSSENIAALQQTIRHYIPEVDLMNTFTRILNPMEIIKICYPVSIIQRETKFGKKTIDLLDQSSEA
jgi:hypothetical protein